MRISKIVYTSALIFTLAVLPSCSSKTVSKDASYIDVTANSIYGTISNFSKENKDLKEGDEVSFTVTPSEDFFIDKVTVNGNQIAQDISKENYYTFKLSAGVNRIAASYSVNKEKDFVSDFKLNISDELFAEVMKDPDSSNRENSLDFRKDGIEQVMTKYTDANDYFINYVDGDTTHVSTRNYGYTVKIRYLGIDTPESTSEIEKWGKSASNFNKSILDMDNAKHIILEGQDVSKTGEKAPATADSNQRSLAYVWYSTLENPTKNDFRCLNLEMVYQGYSQGIGSIEDMGDYFYKYFDKANKSAEANKRHIYAGDDVDDPDYFDYTKKEVQELTLKQIYDSSTKGQTDSIYANNKTLYKVKGYVTRKIEGAFFIQDQASYDRLPNGDLPEAYGIYVFTYATTPIIEGDYVEVIAALSTYGGAYQLQGISYHTLNADEKRDTKIISSNNKIEPIELTYAEWKNHPYDNVLVKITDDLYCFNATSTYKGVTSDKASGGSEEIDTYNEHYPFYCTTNKIIAYAAAGSDSKKEDVRFVLTDGVLLDYNGEKSLSYKFFTGGSYKYNYHGAEYVEKDTTKYQEDTVTKTFKRKKMSGTFISQNYLSTSGKTQLYSLVIAASKDINIQAELD